MNIREEMERSFGEDFFTPTSERSQYTNWHEACPCGHLDRYHAPSIGGTFQIPEPYPQSIGGGQTATVTTVFTGCNGALPPRGSDLVSGEPGPEALTVLNTVIITCPCSEFRPVVKVDRPNRYFNQRLPRDRSDHARHPFQVGIRAFMTHLSKRKAALADPDWAVQEFDRRFVWLDGARVCALSRCTTTEDVWPSFITDDGLSELRCAAHR